MLETHICVNNCSIIEKKKRLCILNYESKENEKNKEIEEKVIENVKEEINNLSVSEIEKDDIRIEQKDSIITIIITENQKNSKSRNTTNIYLGECELKIKEEYNISKNNSLLLLKIYVKQEGFKIPKIDYGIYYPLFGEENIKLNFTVCSNLKIDISISASLFDNIDKNNASSRYFMKFVIHTLQMKEHISLFDRKKGL